MRIVNLRFAAGFVALLAIPHGPAASFFSQDGHLNQSGIVQDDGLESVQGDGGQEISFREHVLPVLNKYCVSCHAEDSYKASELSLENFRLLMEGGKHGPVVVGGRPDESLLIRKLDENPPFGYRMPMPRRRASREAPKRLTEGELSVLREWIRQGARDN